MKKNLFLFCLSLALTGTIASCGGGGGGGSSAAPSQSVSDYNPDFLFGSPTGGIVRFYSGNQLIATFRYEDAYISGNKSTSASVYATVYAAGDHRNFLNPCVFEETVTNGQHTFRVLNQALTADSLEDLRNSNTAGTQELSGMGYGNEVRVAFPTQGSTLTYSGDASEGKKHIDEGNIILYFYDCGEVNPDGEDGHDHDGVNGDGDGGEGVIQHANAMEMRATYVRVDPK